MPSLAVRDPMLTRIRHATRQLLGFCPFSMMEERGLTDVTRVAATATIRGGPYRLLAFLNHRAIVDPLQPHVRHHLSRAASYCNHATTQKI
jgi:hypothetical protein